MFYVMCEKRSFAEDIFKSLHKNGIQDICCFGAYVPYFWYEQSDDNGPYWVNIPKKMTFNDIPYCQKPELILKRKYNSFLFNEAGETRNNLDIDFSNGELVYVSDNAGNNQSLLLAELCKHKEMPSKISFMSLKTLRPSDIVRAFKERKPFNLSETNYKLAYTNTMFDASFFLNAIVLFGKFELNIKLTKEHLYCLFATQKRQLPYNIRPNHNSEDVLITGTGKYPPCSLPLVYNYDIFNNISQKYVFIFLLVKDLEACGLLSIKDEVVNLTEKGEAFVNSLHPDCYDPDVFGRIIEWSKLPISDIDNKISQYMKRHFGKQKRFQSNQWKANSPL